MAVSALYNNLVKLQLQQHELNIESKQQTKFRKWIMGEAKAKEYYRCNWITPEELTKISEINSFLKAHETDPYAIKDLEYQERLQENYGLHKK